MTDGIDSNVLSRRLGLLWALMFLGPAVLVVGLTQLSQDPVLGIPRVFFAMSALSMALGSICASKLIRRAMRTNRAELGYLGLFFFAISVMLLGQALRTSGLALFDESVPDGAGAFWALPIAFLAALPAILHRTRAGRAVDAQWRLWVRTVGYMVIVLSILLVLFPDFLPAPILGSWTARVLALIGILACAAYSRRHLYLALVARSPGPLLVTLGYALVGVANLRWFGSAELSVSHWVTQFFAVFGSIVGTLGAIATYKRADLIDPFIEEIVEADPRIALEVGVEPSVLEYIEHLNTAEPATLEHMRRLTALTLRIGARMGLENFELRDLGLAALLHDVGKQQIPRTLLVRTDLEPHEQQIVQRHVVYGAQLLDKSPALRSIAPIVLTHHERIDGNGYPRGLMGPEVPFLTRILTACDAYDALSISVEYNREPDLEETLKILERNAGSRWDRRVVEVLARSVRHDPSGLLPERLELAEHIGCDCLPDLLAA